MSRLVVAAIALVLAACSNVRSLEFSQLVVGSNGPTNPGVFFFDNADEVDKSWIKSALTPSQLTEVLKRVDFKHQVLLAFASSKRSRATGTMIITRVRQFHGGEHPPVDVTVRIGHMEEGCKGTPKTMYLFAIAVVERPAGPTPFGGGYYAENFPDGCGKSAVAD